MTEKLGRQEQVGTDDQLQPQHLIGRMFDFPHQMHSELENPKWQNWVAWLPNHKGSDFREITPES